jgi:hypothetical protein
VGLVLARLGPRGLFFSSVDLTRGLGGDSALNTPQQRSPGLSPVAWSLAATRDLGIEKHSEGMTFCPSTPPSAGHNELLVSQRGVGESSAAQNELLVSHKLQLERTSAEAAQAQALVIKLSDELACGRAEAAASQALVREMSSRVLSLAPSLPLFLAVSLERFRFGVSRLVKGAKTDVLCCVSGCRYRKCLTRFLSSKPPRLSIRTSSRIRLRDHGLAFILSSVQLEAPKHSSD